MSNRLFHFIWLHLIFLLGFSCTRPDEKYLVQIFENRPDSIITRNVLAFIDHDSIARAHIQDQFVFSRIFPDSWPLNHATSIWLIATSGGTCTPLIPSVFNDLCNSNEFAEENEPGDLNWYARQGSPSLEAPLQSDTIDSIDKISKYINQTPNCFQQPTARMGFCHPYGEQNQINDNHGAFLIRISLQNPEPQFWKIEEITCPASDWLLESDSFYFSDGVAAIIKSIYEKRNPSPVEIDKIRDYYLADANYYQSKNLKHLLPGQRELFSWLLKGY